MDKLKSVLLAFAWWVNAGTIVMCYLRKQDMEVLYQTTKRSLSLKYGHQLMPHSAYFWISWPIVFLWNFIGITYMLVLAFLRNSPLNTQPSVVPQLFVVFHILAFGLVMPWEISFDRENLDMCLLLIMLATLCTYIAAGFSCYKLHAVKQDLKQNNPKLFWCYVVVVQNGLALYAANLTVATTLNFVEVVIYKSVTEGKEVKLRGLLSNEDASTLALCVFLVVMVIWFISEMRFYKEYCRYLFTIYPVFMFAAACLLVNLVRFHAKSKNIVVTGIILSLATLMMGFKVFTVCLG